MGNGMLLGVSFSLSQLILYILCQLNLVKLNWVCKNKQTRYIGPMLNLCWSVLADGGTT